jgi:hypothetical protein
VIISQRKTITAVGAVIGAKLVIFSDFGGIFAVEFSQAII